MDKHRRNFLRLAGCGVATAGLTAPHLYAATDASPSQTMRGIYDVRTFGATGDGTTIDTPAVNKAIEAASSAGGGTVRFAAGTYACYSIHLKSNVCLYLEHGATILAAPSPMEGTTSGGYDTAESNAPWESYQDFGHNHWHNSLIWGENIQNFSIAGPGLIWGKGLSRGWEKEQPRAESPGVGNKAIALKNCHNVQLRDFSILRGGHFGILATGVDNLTIDNLIIDTNRDGMDIDCCRNVRISNCSVNSPWDDGICPKSSFALGHPRATENVTISNCYVTGNYQPGTLLDGTFKKFPPGAKVARTGGIKFGTESNGGFRNIGIANCVLEGCHGIALETADGALLEDVSITNITMRDIVSAPLFLRLGSRMRGPKGAAIGQLRRILIGNVVSSNAAPLGSVLSGIPGHCIQDVKISDIYIQHQGGIHDASIQPPELENAYPEATMFGPMPSQGFFLRHMRNVDMSHIEVASLHPDTRPTFVLQDVKGAGFLRIQAPGSPVVPVFALYDVEDFRVDLSRGVPDTKLAKVESRKF